MRLSSTQAPLTTVSRVDEIPEQIFAIDKETGAVTYITGQSATHDGVTGDDGSGNTLAFTIAASDGVGEEPTAATVMVTVRVNVAPSAIAMTSNDGANTPPRICRFQRGVLRVRP